MATFSAQVYQNEFLPDGGTDVHAIVTVTCSGAGTVGGASSPSGWPAGGLTGGASGTASTGIGGGEAGEIIVVDTSGSMGKDKIVAAQAAAAAALDQINDGVWFAVIAGNHVARLAFPAGSEGGMARMSPGTRDIAKAAVRSFYADGGTAMGTWLRLAAQVFDSIPGLVHKHAILLTDGENQHETPQQLTANIEFARGKFQADCRGVGADWQVAELRRISEALMGTIDVIPSAHQLEEVFATLMRQSMSRGVAAASLRVWAPLGAHVLFVRQVAPQVEDLSARRQEVNALTGAYPTGSWGDESRDFHVAVRLPAKAIGQEQLAARVQLALGEQVVAQGLVKAKWSSDDTLTTRISPEVAHYTGQAELAAAIQDGLAAKAAGDAETATAKLGRAVQLAAATGNDEATSRLRKVVEIENPETGTVRLRRGVDKLDEMALDTASTKTTRVKK